MTHFPDLRFCNFTHGSLKDAGLNLDTFHCVIFKQTKKSQLLISSLISSGKLLSIRTLSKSPVDTGFPKACLSMEGFDTEFDTGDSYCQSPPHPHPLKWQPL